MSGPLSRIKPVIVLLPIHVSVFCCGLIRSHYLCLFLHAWLSRQGFRDRGGEGGGDFETGVGSTGGHWVAVFCVCIDYFC